MSAFEEAIEYCKKYDPIPLTLEMMKSLEPNVSDEEHEEFIAIATQEQKEAIIRALYWNPLYDEIKDQAVSNKLLADSVFISKDYAIKCVEINVMADTYVMKKHCATFDGTFTRQLLNALNEIDVGGGND